MTNAELQAIYSRAYEEGAASFFTRGTEDITAEVLKEGAPWAGKTVIELGCGNGYTARQIAARGASVMAFDASERAIEIADASPTAVDFQVGGFGDADRWPAGVDTIVLQEVLEHTDSPASVLRDVARHLAPGGSVIITCPSFLNLRGYVWMTLATLLDVPMSLTDLHFIMPWDIHRWATQAKLTVWHMRTFRHDQAHGAWLIKDFEKRLPNALRDAGLPTENVAQFLTWLAHACKHQGDNNINGSTALYHLRRL